eukprot:XP_001709241.1 Hypothetical protein GL50803_32210 [Giardia lamblia ATCC 50803]
MEQILSHWHSIHGFTYLNRGPAFGKVFFGYDHLVRDARGNDNNLSRHPKREAAGERTDQLLVRIFGCLCKSLVCNQVLYHP